MITVELVSNLIAQFLPEPHAGLLSGILFGAKAQMAPDLYQALITTGTLHIVALSGTNISILTGLINLTLIYFLPRRIASLLTIIIIIGFVMFVGPSPSVVRAALMGSLTLIALIFGRPVWAFWSWCIAVITMLSFSPGLITDISFQLSAGATLGMILFGQGDKSGTAGAVSKSIIMSLRGPASRRGRGNPVNSRDCFAPPGCARNDKVSEVQQLPDTGYPMMQYANRLLTSALQLLNNDLHLTLSAQVFTIPIILAHFHRISLISPLPNLLIGFILPPLTGLGLIIAVTALVFPPLAQILSWFAFVLLEYVIRVVMWTSRIPFASFGF